MTQVVEQTLRLPEARVHVRQVGEGPSLLLLNGLGAHSAMWRSLEDTLTGFRIITFDLPGAGQSDTPWKPMSVSSLARLAVSVMDHFGLDRPDVLGYSMGGIVAQQMAADAPDRVRRLVLVATTPGIGAVQGDVKAILNVMSPARYLNTRLYTRTIGTLAGGRARHDEAWVADQGHLRLKHPPSWRGYLGQLSSIATWSSLPFLSRIEHPVLVLNGGDDPLAPVVNGKLIAHLLPNGRLVVLAGEGHLMLMDTDSGSHPAIRDFLSAWLLDRAETWRQADPVDAESLRRALADAGCQLPPWNLANSFMRRRWVRAG